MIFQDCKTGGIHGDHTDNEYEYIDSDTGDNHGVDTDGASAAAFAAITADSATARCAALDGRCGRRRAVNDLGGGVRHGRRGCACARGPVRPQCGQRAARPEAVSARTYDSRGRWGGNIYARGINTSAIDLYKLIIGFICGMNV